MKTHLMLTTAVALVLGTAAGAQSPSSEGKQNSTRPNAASTSSGSGNSERSAADQGASGTNTNSSPSRQGGSGTAHSNTANTPPSSNSNSADSSTSKQSGAGSAAPTQQGQNTPAGRADTSRGDSTNHDNANSAQTAPPSAGANSSSQDRAQTNGAPSTGGSQAGSPASTAPTNSAGRNSETDTSSATEAARVNLDEKQRARLSQTFARLDVRPLTSVNFSVAVGTVIPRDVRLQPLPADVVEVVPQYRGFDFVAVRQEIVIVDPRSYKIVAVLPRGGAGTAATSTRRKVTFSDREREVIRRHSRSLATSRVESRTTGSTSTSRLRVGDRIPESVTIEAFPEEVYRDAPEVREYRYIQRENRTYVIEPEERRIIEEID